MHRHINITISGRVQGVGFRYSAMAIAQRYNISGFTRNMPNGDVYIEAEGDDNNLDSFLAWCKQGPEHAKVSNVICSHSSMKNYNNFIIKA